MLDFGTLTTLGMGPLKWSLKKNYRVYPISTRLFLVYNIYVPLNASLRLFRFKIDQFVPFCIFSMDFADFQCKKGQIDQFKI